MPDRFPWAGEKVAFATLFHIKQTVRKHLVIMGLLILASVVQIFYYYPQLPEVIASHFNSTGTANGWQPKRAFFGLYSGVLVFLVSIFLGLPPFLDRVPNSLINLPRKEYWLAPKRRAETFSFINAQMLIYGNATLAFILVVFQLALQTNLRPQKQLASTTMLPILGAYILFSLVWTVRFIRKFKK